ncbi:Transmembrane protein 256 like [Pseudolycoriella hygida]|uniref:Transmembrane protein 256 like n=1 Tax=Pseudolycoriella hygida TaxID=35572 RepID=A0A9Q0RUN7_9DIPT|nr:Transmembrane protein 256 like [Pseudolycoriella hygida]
MGYGIVETTNYLLFTNPVSQGVFTGLSEVARGLGITPRNGANKQVAAMKTVNAIKIPLYDLAGRNLLFTRIAGISGASAIAVNAYYTQYHKPNLNKHPELKQIFEKTNKFHFIHSLVLLAVPLVRRPWLTGSVMITAMVFFCGSGYYQSLTGNSKYRNVAVVGNCLFFVSWLTMLL